MSGFEVETERLRLRMWEPDDWQELHRTQGDPRVASWLNNPEPTTEMTAFSVGRYWMHWQAHGFGPWAVVEKASGRLVGRAGLHHHRDWPHDETKVEAGWAFEPAVWGRGYATEAAKASLAFAFDRLTLPRVFSMTVADNERSQAVIHRLGMTPRGDVFFFGRDQVWYAIDRDDWNAANTEPPVITIRAV